MKEEEFQELAESVRQAKAIMEGRESPSTKFVVEADRNMISEAFLSKTTRQEGNCE